MLIFESPGNEWLHWGFPPCGAKRHMDIMCTSRLSVQVMGEKLWRLYPVTMATSTRHWNWTSVCCTCVVCNVCVCVCVCVCVHCVVCNVCIFYVYMCMCMPPYPSRLHDSCIHGAHVSQLHIDFCLTVNTTLCSKPQDSTLFDMTR